MNVSPGFDPIKNKITISIKTNLLIKYFSNFSGLIKNDESMPEGTDVEQESENSALISFPAPNDAVKRETENMKAIAIDARIISHIESVVDMFTRASLRKELKTNEFVPLEGYPIENLQEEILLAYKAGRNYCIIKNYDEYLTMSKEGKYTFHQYILNKENSRKEYLDTTILIREGKLDEVKKKFEGKLKLENWC